MKEAASIETIAKPLILLAEDDESLATVIQQALRKQGFSVRRTDNGKQLLEWVKAGQGDLIITDVVMPELSGLEALSGIRQLRPELAVIVISAQSTLMTAVEASKRGSNEYFPKPFDLHELMHCVRSLLPNASEALEPTTAALLPSPSLLIGISTAMQPVYRAIAKLAPVDLTVMLEGESGTGKEIIARVLHELGPRKEKPFIAINMAAIPRDLIESELFGHEKGAFTGAHVRRKGKFSQAEGGTLFLDELGDMPLDAQAKLLRILQEGEYTPVGSEQPQRANVRIICATHQNLLELCQQGKFRDDLYYRLHVVPILVPPLRERQEDIPLLVQHFLNTAHGRGLPVKKFDDAAMRMLQSYNWPGNVREMENLVYRMCVLITEAVIHEPQLKKFLSANIASETKTSANFANAYQNTIASMLTAYFEGHRPNLPPAGIYDRIIQQTEKPLISLALAACNGNQIQAAQLLGINRNTLRKKIRELNIEVTKTVKTADNTE